MPGAEGRGQVGLQGRRRTVGNFMRVERPILGQQYELGHT